MGEQVFEVEKVMEAALKVLREAKAPMTTGAVTVKLGMPLYAVDAALERAHQLRRATFMAGPGWVVAPGDCLKEGGWCQCTGVCKKKGVMKGGAA